MTQAEKKPAAEPPATESLLDPALNDDTKAVASVAFYAFPSMAEILALPPHSDFIYEILSDLCAFQRDYAGTITADLNLSVERYDAALRRRIGVLMDRPSRSNFTKGTGKGKGKRKF